MEYLIDLFLHLDVHLAEFVAQYGIWVYAGLFAVVLGIASHDTAKVAGWSLSVLGALAAIAGVVLIVVRSRLRETGPGKAESKS